MTGSDDSVAVAPNAGTGYGKASASNNELAGLVFELYFDEDSIELDEEKNEENKKPAPKSDCDFRDIDNMKDWYDCKNG